MQQSLGEFYNHLHQQLQLPHHCVILPLCADNLPHCLLPIHRAAALRFYLYSQLEVITAKMLGKYVPSGGPTGARVIQLGGGTRELYYYPKDIVLVTNVGEKVNKGVCMCAKGRWWRSQQCVAGSC